MTATSYPTSSPSAAPPAYPQKQDRRRQQLQDHEITENAIRPGMDFS